MTTRNSDSKEDPQAFAPRVTFTSLNMDILYNVMSYIGSKRTLLALMSMSRALFSLGLPQLLGRTYWLSDSTIESFHEFLVFTSPRSFGALRSLVFRDLQPVRRPLVAEILQRASGLKVLDVRIGLVRAVCDAIVSLTNLRELQLASCGYPNLATGRRLAQIQSPLTRMDIQFSVDLGDPISHFSSVRHSLVYMRINNIKLSPANPQPCYPKLVHLELHRCSLDSKPSLSILMTAFPNLQHLEIDYSMQARRDSIRDLDRIRQENLEWKERPHQWQSLQFVSVDKWCFNALALRGKVPSLDVNSYLSFPPAEQTSRLRAAFSRLKIERLTLRVQSELTQLPLLFSTSLDTLAQLHLDVLFRPEATETCRQQLDAVFDALTRLRHLRGLYLVLAHPYGVPRLAPVKKFLKRLDMPILAVRAFTASPVIISIELLVRGGSLERTSHWTVLGEKENRQLYEARNHTRGPNPDSDTEG